MVYHAWISNCILLDFLVCKWNRVYFAVHSHNTFPLLTIQQSRLFAVLPFIYSMLDGIITLSKTDSEFWGQFNKTIFQTVNPIRYSSVREIPESKLNGKTIIWCQRFSGEKRPEDAIEIFYRIHKRLPEAKLMMLGKGDTSEILENIKSKIEYYGLEESVQLLGYIKHVEEYYKLSAVCMITSEFEGFSLGLMESMGAGVPVVMYDLPYLTIVEKGKGIITVENHDMNQMADEIVSLLEDDTRRRRLGEDARKAIQELLEFDYKEEWRGFFNIIQTTQYAPQKVSIVWQTLLRYYEQGCLGASEERKQHWKEQWESGEQIKQLRKRNQELENRIKELTIESKEGEEISETVVDESKVRNEPSITTEPITHSNSGSESFLLENDREQNRSPVSGNLFSLFKNTIRRTLHRVLPSSRHNVSWSYQNLTEQLQSLTRMLSQLMSMDVYTRESIDRVNQRLEYLEQNERWLDQLTHYSDQISSQIEDLNNQIHAQNISYEDIMKNGFEKTAKILGMRFDGLQRCLEGVLLDNEVRERRTVYERTGQTAKPECLRAADLKKIPDVSVIVPIYNVEPYLPECLESVIGQTLRNIEIICINDGSTDQSLQIALAYGEKDKRISVYSQPNLGLSATRNRGVLCARGTYLYFMDGDDVLKQEALLKMTEKAFQEDLGIVFCNGTAFSDEEGFLSRVRIENKYLNRKHEYLSIYSGKELLSEMVRNGDYSVPVWLQMVRRELFINSSLWFIDGVLCEDNAYTYRCCAKAARASCISDTVYLHRMRRESIMTADSGFERIRGLFLNYLDMAQTYFTTELSPSERQAFECVLVRIKKNIKTRYKKLTELEKSEYHSLSYLQRRLFEIEIVGEGTIRGIPVQEFTERAILTDPVTLLQQIENAGVIPEELLKDARVLQGRQKALQLLPKGGYAAEIGVEYGDFSDVIIDTLQPQHFYAIDHFKMRDIWGRNDLQESGLTQEEWYRERFRKLIPERVTVCKGVSWDVLNQFEDDFFDFLYIDASHRYEDVTRDIEAAERKVKNGGIIQFNDYTMWDPFNSCYYGVIPAVNEFIKRTGSQVLYYCLNEYGFDDIVIRLSKNSDYQE